MTGSEVSRFGQRNAATIAAPAGMVLVDADGLMSIDQLAVYMGVPKSTLYYWRVEGRGPRGMRLGKYVRQGYPSNRSSLGSWSILAPTCATRDRWASSRRGFRPMRTAWTTWSGCAGRLASCVRVAATPGLAAR